VLEFSTIFKFYPGNFGYKLSALGPGQEVALDLVGKIGLQPSNMASNLSKKLLLVAVSAVASAALLVGTYEVYKSIQYEQWKSTYHQSREWYGGLTIPSDNETLMWEYRPQGEAKKWGATIRTNSHGFRDREHELVKIDGVRRVAFVGDSVTLGIGVDEEKFFVRQFENAAQHTEQRPKVEVLSFAVDAYNAIQVLELLRTKAIRYMLDEVIYVMSMNDFDFEQASPKIMYFKKPKSFFLREIEIYYRSKFEYHSYHFQKNKRVVYQDILRTKAILKEMGINFRVALIPIFTQHTFENYPLAQMHEELRTWLTENGVSVINFLEAFLEQQRPPRAFAIDIWHLNKEGHRIVALGMAEALLASPAGRTVVTDMP
jgi:lysophospholipase L1-like esterase